MLQYKTLHAHQQSNLVFYVTLCSASVVHRISFSSARSASPFWVRRRTHCYKQKKNKSSNCLQPKMFLFLVPVLNTCCFCFKNSSCSDITEAPGGSLHKLSPTHTVHIKLTKKKKKKLHSMVINRPDFYFHQTKNIDLFGRFMVTLAVFLGCRLLTCVDILHQHQQLYLKSMIF